MHARLFFAVEEACRIRQENQGELKFGTETDCHAGHEYLSDFYRFFLENLQ